MKTVDATYTRKHLVLEYDGRIGPAIAKIRSKRKVDQSDVARVFGCGQSLISKIETGQRSLKVSELGLLAQALDIPLPELLEELLPLLES